MFLYWKDGATNLVVTLSELETATALTGSAGSLFHPEAKRWFDFATTVVRAIDQGGRLHIVLEGRFPDAPRRPDGPCPYAEAPVGVRHAIDDALALFAANAHRALDTARIDFVP